MQMADDKRYVTSCEYFNSSVVYENFNLILDIFRQPGG